MKRLLATLVLLAFFSSGAIAEELDIGRFCLDNPLGETKVEKLGVEALECSWPTGVEFKEKDVQLIVVDFDKEAVDMISENASVYTLALSTYLGLYKEPEEINKTLFFGETGARNVYSTSIPRPNKVHVFSKKLKDGSFVMVGVRYFTPPNGETGGLLRAIANSFKLRQ